MADIVIKRKITLEFLGDDHKGDYLVFRAVPVDDYNSLIGKETTDNKEAIQLIIDTLKDKFVEGRFQEQDVKKEDIGKFDAQTTQKCFAVLTGQDIDPKD